MLKVADFLRVIAANLYDDSPRLIYADWLEEHGDPERAEFIRVQCELEPIRDRYEIESAAKLHEREDELLQSHLQEWLGPGMEGWDRWREDGASAEFRRGFVDSISLPVRTFLEVGAAVRQLHPTIRRVVLFRVQGYGERLAACEALQGLAELELACWYADADAEAIAASPYLDQLQVLELWLGRQHELTDSELCRNMASSKAWPNLRALKLLNPNDEDEINRKGLVALANGAAGREMATYCRGWSELFPFAADFWYTFPGYLPDGRMAMAAEDHRTAPPTLCVITFDSKGKQTDDVLAVSLPDYLLSIPVDKWYQHKERVKQHLIETIGFRPGFIRVQDYQFPGDESWYNSPAWEVYSWQGEEAQFGVPDADDEDSWAEHPCGYAGEFARRLRNQEYVFGWDRYADKRGLVHST